jgi:2-haloalkanoic acid dehalogenase type II
MPDVRPRIRAVLFDVGGTLVYEPDIYEWAERARRCSLDIDPNKLSDAYVEVLIEVDAKPQSRDPEAAMADFWRRTLSRAAQKDVSESTAAQFVAVRKDKSAPVQLYSDTRPCLDQLRQDHRPLGVISNSDSEARVRQVLNQGGILEYFDRIVSSGTEGVEKPDPEIFLRAVQRMGVRPAEALYVGNKAVIDAKAAQSAGLYGVWVNREGTGFGEAIPEIASLLEVLLCVRRIEQGLSVARTSGPAA